MKISIVTAVYNCEKYIEETLESVLEQRGDFELEYIVIDGQSTDSTFDKINKYKALVESGFYTGRNKGITFEVISEKDSGMYDAIAKGFRKCTGDVVAYINADDFYIPNAFACVTEIFEQNSDVKWLTGRCSFYNEKGHNTFSILRIFEDVNLIRKGGYGLFSPYYIPQESTFWKMELLKKIDLEVFSKYKKAGDFYLWHVFSKFEKLHTVNSVFSGFRTVENQLSSNLSSYHDEMQEIVGDVELSAQEKIKLDKIIEINENLVDRKKYDYGIFHYDSCQKKWVTRTNKFLPIGKKKKKVSIKGLISRLILLRGD